MKKLTYVLAALFSISLSAAAYAAEGDPISTELNVLDVPTTDTLDRYEASFQTRAYAHGDIMETIDFGIYPRLNIGVNVAVHQLVGDSSSVRILNPDFQVKWKIYDGDLNMPSIAIGYDGHRYGYGYDSDRNYTKTKKYLDNRRGGYVTFSREIFTPGLNASAGLNLSDFDWDKFAGFAGLSWRMADFMSLISEWDNIHNWRDSRVNTGLRFYLHPSLSVDGAVRRIGRGKESERILQIRYVTNF